MRTQVQGPHRDAHLNRSAYEHVGRNGAQEGFDPGEGSLVLGSLAYERPVLLVLEDLRQIPARASTVFE